MPTLGIGNNTTFQNTSRGALDSTVTGTTGVALRQEAPDFNYSDAAENLALGNGTDDNSVFMIDVDLSSVPAGSTITSIYAYVNGGGGFGTIAFSAYRSLRPWVLAQATYNSYSTGNAWQTAPGTGANDRDAANKSPSVSISGAGYVELDLSNFIADMQASNDGLACHPDTFNNDDGFRFLVKHDGTDGERPEVWLEYSLYAISNVSGTISAGSQITLTTANLGTITTVTLGGQALTIDSTATNSVTATIPADVSLKWGDSYTLTAGDGTNSASLDNQTLAVRSGWAVIDYAGPTPDVAETESFYELAINDRSFTPAVGDQLRYTTASGLSVNDQWIPTVNPVNNVTGQYSIYDDSASSSLATQGFQIIGQELFTLTMSRAMVRAFDSSMVSGMSG